MLSDSKKTYIKHIYSKQLLSDGLDIGDNEKLKLIEKYKNFLLNKLNDEQKKIFFEFLQANDELYKSKLENAFMDGVNLGIKLSLDSIEQ